MCVQQLMKHRVERVYYKARTSVSYAAWKLEASICVLDVRYCMQAIALAMHRTRL